MNASTRELTLEQLEDILSIACGKEKINDELIRNFIDDLDKSLRDAGIGDMSIGKYVKKYVKKFYFRIKIIDPVLNNLDNLKLINYLKSIKITNDKNFTELAQDLLIIAKKIKNH